MPVTPEDWWPVRGPSMASGAMSGPRGFRTSPVCRVIENDTDNKGRFAPQERGRAVTGRLEDASCCNKEQPKSHCTKHVGKSHPHTENSARWHAASPRCQVLTGDAFQSLTFSRVTCPGQSLHAPVPNALLGWSPHTTAARTGPAPAVFILGAARPAAEW